MTKNLICVVALAVAACGSDSGEGAVSGAPAADGPTGSAPPSPGEADPSLGGPAGPAPAQAPAAKGPPYPIVLAHGFFGFETLAGVDAITYFYGVKDELARQGETLVFTPAVDPFNDSIRRGAQLLARIEEILATTGYAKVDIIAHSQGGLDARVVAHDRPDRVASVVTFATPHRGMPLSDMAFGVEPGAIPANVVDALVKAAGGPLWDEVGNETSLAKAFKQFSNAEIEAFNARYPDAAGVRYLSLTGRSGLSSGGDDCDVPGGAPPFVAKWKSDRDPINGLLAGAWTLDGGQLAVNDGFVPASSARWGTFLGCVPADHFDEIGQLFGQSPGLGNGFEYKELYVALVQHLRALGY